MYTIGYAAQTAGAPLAPFPFKRRELRSNDVAIEILFCGVCHSDLHQARNDWGVGRYPLVPGHEIIGKVIAVGDEVTRYKAGDAVAVGCLVDSCLQCQHCHEGEEQFCTAGSTETYNSFDRHSKETNFGGYAKHIVVREEFVLRMPEGLDLSRAAPLLCAGITTYSPLRTWNVGPGSRVAVIGLGGLGHMAVKLANGLGADVTVISRSSDKQADALLLGADRLLVSTDKKAMYSTFAASFDLIIDTVPIKHDISPYIPLLKVDGTLVLVGQIGPLVEPNTVPLMLGRRRIAGSLIGGVRETQELLDFCAKKNILPDCELIGIEHVNEAFERLERADVRYRFVIDMASLSAPT